MQLTVQLDTRRRLFLSNFESFNHCSPMLFAPLCLEWRVARRLALWNVFLILVDDTPYQVDLIDLQ